MKFYLAARFAQRPILATYRQQLIDLGHTCNCRWLTDPTHRIEVDDLPANIDSFNRMLAFHDLHDLQAADTIIFFSPGGTRGGCHVEFGIAIGTGKRLLWVGARTHVFSWLPQVEVFADWESCLKSIEKEGPPHD